AGLVELIHRVGSRLLWAAVPFVVACGLYRYYRFLRGRELRGEPVAPVSVLELPPPPAEPEPLPPAKAPTPGRGQLSEGAQDAGRAGCLACAEAGRHSIRSALSVGWISLPQRSA